MCKTIWDLKKKIQDLPDDMPILYDRIEDVYFEKHWWEASYLYHENEKDKILWVEPDQYINVNNIFVSDGKLLITAHQ